MMPWGWVVVVERGRVKSVRVTLDGRWTVRCAPVAKLECDHERGSSLVKVNNHFPLSSHFQLNLFTLGTL